MIEKPRSVSMKHQAAIIGILKILMDTVGLQKLEEAGGKVVRRALFHRAIFSSGIRVHSHGVVKDPRSEMYY